MVPAGQICAALVTAEVAAVTASVSVAVLLPALISFSPGGAVIVTVLVTVPVAAVMLLLAVNVRAPPEGSVGMVAPAWKVLVVKPDGHTAPPAPEQVTLTSSKPALAGSVTTALLTADGPAFDTTMVYAVTPLAKTLLTPFDLVTLRSAVGVLMTVVAVPVLLLGDGSVKPVGRLTVAVFVMLPALMAVPLMTILS